MSAASPTLPLAVSHDLIVTELPHRPNALAGRWSAMKACLSEIIGTEKVAAWLDKLTLDRIDGAGLVFAAPSKFMANYIATHFAERILEAWWQTGGATAVRDVRVVVERSVVPIEATDQRFRVRKQCGSERMNKALHRSQALHLAHCATSAQQIRAKMNLKTGWKDERGE